MYTLSQRCKKCIYYHKLHIIIKKNQGSILQDKQSYKQYLLNRIHYYMMYNQFNITLCMYCKLNHMRYIIKYKYFHNNYQDRQLNIIHLIKNILFYNFDKQYLKYKYCIYYYIMYIIKLMYLRNTLRDMQKNMSSSTNNNQNCKINIMKNTILYKFNISNHKLYIIMKINLDKYHLSMQCYMSSPINNNQNYKLCTVNLNYLCNYNKPYYNFNMYYQMFYHNIKKDIH